MSCSPRLKAEIYYEEKTISQGSFGRLSEIQYLCEKTGVEKKFSMKTFDVSKIGEPSEREEVLEEAKKEYEILKRGIPNILKAHGSFYDEQEMKFRFSTDFMHTDLYSFISKRGPLDVKTFISIYTDILRGKRPFFFKN